VPPLWGHRSVDFVLMTAPEPSPKGPSPAGPRRKKQALALVEAAGADGPPSGDDSAPPMAVSIAGVSTACSKDALVSSAKAVRKTLTPE
jgi:hypothetical protein